MAPNASAEVTAWLVLSAFIGIVVGDNLWRSPRVLGARRVILIDILKPFIALGMAKAALGEGVSVAVALGMCVTLGGVLTVSLEENRTGDEENGEIDRDFVKNDTNAFDTVTDVAETSDVEGVVGAVDEYETPEHLRASASSAPRRNPAGLKTKTLKPPFSPSVFVGGYVAAAANVALDTWGTVLTKQHGGGLNTWEINFVRFGSAAATLALVAAAKRTAARFGRRTSDVSYRDAETTNETKRIFPVLSKRSWVQILLGVSFTTFLAPGLGNYALFRVSSLAVFSTLMCVGPIYALPLGKMVNDEPITARAVIGSVVAILGTTPMFFGKQLALS